MASILEAAPHWKVRCRKDHIIYEEGEPLSAMYRIDSGCVRLQVNGLSGDRQIIGFLFPGDTFGFCQERHNSAAEAVTDVELTRYGSHFESLDDGAADAIRLALLSRLDDMFGEVAHHIQRVAHLTATQRILWFFEWLAQRQGHSDGAGQIDVPMSHKDIADFLCLTPETLSRTVKILSSQGELVRISGHSLVLHPHRTDDPTECVH